MLGVALVAVGVKGKRQEAVPLADFVLRRQRR
jgi:hypothetical protein